LETLNLDIWVAWPTVNIVEANDMAAVWKKQGYKVAVLVEEPVVDQPHIDTIITISEWKGFPHAANTLCKSIEYDIIVIAGNDLYPELRRPAQILGAEFIEHFGGTNGIMHPTGDRYGLIDEASICPWIGKDYGIAPYNEEYYHYYCDGELQDVAVQKGTFWQRPDVIQYHDHWGRTSAKRPKHLMPALAHHPEDKATYERRKANGFQ